MTTLNTDQMTLVELLATDAGLQLFRYRPVGDEWRSAFYRPVMQPDPRAWLERNNIGPIAEIDLRPSTKPADISAEAWACELQRREGVEAKASCGDMRTENSSFAS